MVIVLCVGVLCMPVQKRAEVILSRHGTAGETIETVLSVLPGSLYSGSSSLSLFLHLTAIF